MRELRIDRPCLTDMEKQPKSAWVTVLSMVQECFVEPYPTQEMTLLPPNPSSEYGCKLTVVPESLSL
jgi:hypothetical protein